MTKVRSVCRTRNSPVWEFSHIAKDTKFGQGLEELTPQERHDYLQMLVEQVTIDKDNKVHIAMAFPIDDDCPDPDSPDPEPLQPESMSIGSAKPSH